MRDLKQVNRKIQENQTLANNEELGQAEALPTIIIKPTRGWLSLKLRDIWQYRELLYFLTWRDVKGRLGSLLEVGTGFHPELTGRENIYLSGAILGMTKRVINRKFDEMVDFKLYNY